jgi:hypothetical protein
MIQFRMKQDGRVVTEEQYRREHDTIFPAGFTPTDADPIFETPAPATDSTHMAVKSGIKQDNLGNWVYDWDIVAKPQAQIDAEFKATVPVQVTMRQARRALLDAGKLATVTAAINSLPSPMKEQAQIDWEYSQVVERNWPLVAALMPALQMNEHDIDLLFIAASKLKA